MWRGRATAGSFFWTRLELCRESEQDGVALLQAAKAREEPPAPPVGLSGLGDAEPRLKRVMGARLLDRAHLADLKDRFDLGAQMGVQEEQLAIYFWKDLQIWRP